MGASKYKRAHTRARTQFYYIQLKRFAMMERKEAFKLIQMQNCKQMSREETKWTNEPKKK